MCGSLRLQLDMHLFRVQAVGTKMPAIQLVQRPAFSLARHGFWASVLLMLSSATPQLTSQLVQR